jgi:hypothetical protein
MASIAPRRFVYFFLLFCFLLGLAACGGGGSNNMAPTPTPATLPFSSGLYQIGGTPASSSAVAFALAGSLMQSGNSVSGVMHMSASSCFAFNTDIPVNGTLGTDASGNFTVDLAVALPSGQTLTLNTIHPGGHLSILAGTYSLVGAGCATPSQGSASGNILDISGTNWIGTLTSNSGPVSQINLSLTQIGPDAHGFFTASGTGTITGGTCFSGVTVDPSSVVVGAGSTLVFDNSQTGATGTITLRGVFLPLPFGGASFLGAYSSTQGTCSDLGTVEMSFS